MSTPEAVKHEILNEGPESLVKRSAGRGRARWG